MSVPSTGERTIGNGRYVLLREIGWGGAGVVWRGEDRVIQRPVAIKEAIMSRNLLDQQRDEAMQRMLREVRATGQLNHPAALTIHDVFWGEEAGAAYIVMELVDGSSLAEVLKPLGHPAVGGGAGPAGAVAPRWPAQFWWWSAPGRVEPCSAGCSCLRNRRNPSKSARCPGIPR